MAATGLPALLARLFCTPLGLSLVFTTVVQRAQVGCLLRQLEVRQPSAERICLLRHDNRKADWPSTMAISNFCFKISADVYSGSLR